MIGDRLAYRFGWWIAMRLPERFVAWYAENFVKETLASFDAEQTKEEE